MKLKVNRFVATFAIAVIGSSFAAAWLVRQNGTGNVQGSEVKLATGLLNSDFQVIAKANGFAFNLNRQVDYNVPCRHNGNGKLTWYLFHALETNVSMIGTPVLNTNGSVTKFDLSRGTGGSITWTNAANQTVTSAGCPSNSKHDQNYVPSMGLKTTITPISGGLYVAYMDDEGNVQVNPLAN